MYARSESVYVAHLALSATSALVDVLTVVVGVGVIVEAIKKHGQNAHAMPFNMHMHTHTSVCVRVYLSMIYNKHNKNTRGTRSMLLHMRTIDPLCVHFRQKKRNEQST